MAKTSEILTSILILSIIIFLFIFYKDKILKNKHISKISEIFNIGDNGGTQSPMLFNLNKESSDNLFATEYEVSDDANEAISDALKNVE